MALASPFLSSSSTTRSAATGSVEGRSRLASTVTFSPAGSHPRRGVSATAPANSEKPSGPRSRKGAETRARLVEAAEQIFAEHGFLDARIADIAERAQLSHGSFYHYFDSKEQIFRE